MMNNKALMGKFMPAGRNRIIWNTLMILAVTLITSASLYMLWMRGGLWGLAALFAFLAIVGYAEWHKRKNKNSSEKNEKQTS
jgi:flagellar basal body-associated protein FliL